MTGALVAPGAPPLAVYHAGRGSSHRWAYARDHDFCGDLDEVRAELGAQLAALRSVAGTPKTAGPPNGSTLTRAGQAVPGAPRRDLRGALYAVVAKGGHIQNDGQWMTGLDEVS